MLKKISILVIEDNEGDWVLIKNYLNENFIDQYIDHSNSIASALQCLKLKKYDIVLLDLSLPDSKRFESIENLYLTFPETPIIVLTGYEDQKFAVETLKKGVQDYLLKDEITPLLLLKAINYGIERHNTIQTFKNIEKQKLIEIANAIIKAQEKEKIMLSNELHDNINQILACSRMFLGMAELKKNKTTEYIQQADELLISAITEIRNLSHSLAPPSFMGLNFSEAIDKLIENFTKASGIIVKTSWRKTNFIKLSEKMAINVFRIIQEQLNNINKYAHAKNIKMTFTHDKNIFYLSIKDDGIGFDTTKQTNGIGMYNIKTRATLFNGSAEFITVPLEGCELYVVLIDDQIDKV